MLFENLVNPLFRDSDGGPDLFEGIAVKSFLDHQKIPLRDQRSQVFHEIPERKGGMRFVKVGNLDFLELSIIAPIAGIAGIFRFLRDVDVLRDVGFCRIADGKVEDSADSLQAIIRPPHGIPKARRKPRPGLRHVRTGPTGQLERFRLDPCTGKADELCEELFVLLHSEDFRDGGEDSISSFVHSVAQW